MGKEYVVKITGSHGEAYRIGESRVSLDSIVYSWLQGESPETITENFPNLSLEQVYGAIAFYLANRAMIDEYMRQSEARAETMRQERSANGTALYRRLLALKLERKRQAA